MLFEMLETFLQTFCHHVELYFSWVVVNPYLGFGETDVDVFVADEAKDQTIDGLGDIVKGVGWDKECLHCVIFEGFSSELDVFVTDVCKHCCLRMDLIILSCFSDYAPFNVTEQSKMKTDKEQEQLTQRSECLVPYLSRGSSWLSWA